MNLPLVAVTAMRSSRVEGLRAGGHVVSEKVLLALMRSGAVPVMLSPAMRAADVPLDSFDAVVIPGGADVEPSLYGGRQRDAHGKVDVLQDQFEIGLVRRCIERRMPLLAICRGMQVLNIALGGGIMGDVPVNAVPHRNGYHDVVLEEHSQVWAAVGRARLAVSSYHHQAIDQLGTGLRVVGRTDDGVIEAVEHENARVLAVQWHPEDDAAENRQDQALFDALIRMTSATSA